MSELKETKKRKVFDLYEQTPKQVEPNPNPQNSLFWHQKKPKTTWEKMLFLLDLNYILKHNSYPMKAQFLP